MRRLLSESEDYSMKLSARNQFPGTVTKVTEGAVNGIVTIDVNGTPVASTISKNITGERTRPAGKRPA